MRATLTSEIGPWNGMSETVKAAEAANPAIASGSSFLSPEIKVTNSGVSA
jgi:hypothetical protein